MLGAPSITEIRSFTQILSTSELLALGATPVQVVPPPGNGKIVWPISVMLIYNFGGVDFSTTAVAQVVYAGSGNSALENAPLTPFGFGQSTYQGAPGLTAAGFAATANDDLNQPLQLTLSAGTTPLHGVGAASVTAGGTGYAIGDTGTITTGNGNATYRVLTVSGLGAVLTFAITFPGSGYATGAGQATATGGAQPGVGINFTVNVTALVNGNGTLKVTTLYQVIDVP